ELRAALAEELPSYMIPSYFVQLEQMPLAPNGKLDRKLLPAPEGLINIDTVHIAPRTPLEARLVRIWQEVLGVERIGVKEDFFELGGHSLRATTLVSKVHKALHVQFPLRDVFRFSTLEAMAKAIEGLEQQQFHAIPTANSKPYYPLSSAQKRIYILHQMAGAQQSYNMPGAVTIRGHIDRTRLEAAFRELIARHETLRTSFETVAGEAVQRIHPQVEFAVEYIQAEGKELEQIASQFVRDFELEQPPLLRVGLVEIAAGHHLLLFDMHHIVSDGVSMAILVDEFTRLYSGEQLVPLRIQYKDYVEWLKMDEQQERLKHQEAYWLNTLHGELPLLELPTEYARPEQRSYEGDKLQFSIDREQSDKLQRLAGNAGATLYMVMLAAYTTLLHKYSGQDDLIVGTPIAGRTHSDTEPLIGMFVNSLAIRNYPHPEKSFSSYLEEIKATTLQAYEHQDYPFEALVEKLQVVRNPSRNPLFDTMFILQNTENNSVSLGDLSVEPYNQNHSIAKFDLTLEISMEDGLMSGHFEYCTKLFSTNMIDNFAEDFLNILSQICEQPDIQLGQIQLSGVNGQEEVLEAEIDFAF
ncbi:condensation domain-containing protein, partial [Paenibacillus taiwanensis]|uniref:condensation domain-containing protein n=1 Tax=Paenibacillus taiwanensis TaxID=401638 RepID=UPI003CCC2479